MSSKLILHVYVYVRMVNPSSKKPMNADHVMWTDELVKRPVREIY